MEKTTKSLESVTCLCGRPVSCGGASDCPGIESMLDKGAKEFTKGPEYLVVDSLMTKLFEMGLEGAKVKLIPGYQATPSELMQAKVKGLHYTGSNGRNFVIVSDD